MTQVLRGTSSTLSSTLHAPESQGRQGLKVRQRPFFCLELLHDGCCVLCFKSFKSLPAQRKQTGDSLLHTLAQTHRPNMHTNAYTTLL